MFCVQLLFKTKQVAYVQGSVYKLFSNLDVPPRFNSGEEGSHSICQGDTVPSISNFLY
jgi:hypothetical protein